MLTFGMLCFIDCVAVGSFLIVNSDYCTCSVTQVTRARAMPGVQTSTRAQTRSDQKFKNLQPKYQARSIPSIVVIRT